MRARHHDEFIRLNFGTLYHTVDVLERKGWIVSVEREKEGRRPERTIYKLTDLGREVLGRALGELLRKPMREYPQFVAGLMFMHHLEAATAAGEWTPESVLRRLEAVLACREALELNVKPRIAIEAMVSILHHG